MLVNSESCFVCVEVLRSSQQLRSCRADQFPINTFPVHYFSMSSHLPSDEALEKKDRIDESKNNNNNNGNAIRTLKFIADSPQPVLALFVFGPLTGLPNRSFLEESHT